MYYNFWIDLPEAPGKYVFEKRGSTTYVKYEYRFADPTSPQNGAVISAVYYGNITPINVN